MCLMALAVAASQDWLVRSRPDCNAQAISDAVQVPVEQIRINVEV
jgi:hypothetical protein